MHPFVYMTLQPQPVARITHAESRNGQMDGLAEAHLSGAEQSMLEIGGRLDHLLDILRRPHRLKESNECHEVVQILQKLIRLWLSINMVSPLFLLFVTACICQRQVQVQGGVTYCHHLLEITTKIQ